MVQPQPHPYRNHNTATTPSPTTTRTRPAFEKLLVGPLMILGEMVTGGHYLEVLRLGKQMYQGRSMKYGPSYWDIHRACLSTSKNGYMGAVYRGFVPWGVLQCAKGIPVLFVQHEAQYRLTQKQNQKNTMSRETSELVSGVLGGMAQALFVNPMQKVKVQVVACETLNGLPPYTAFVQVVKENGILSLYDGILPMMLRRSLDWGIRFSVSGTVKNWMTEQKLRDGTMNPQLSFWELILCGLAGGACSACTHPIDNVITNSQKPLPSHKSRTLVAVVRRMYRESGVFAFTRGWCIKVVDNAYHMAWMYGVGTVLYDWMDKNLRDRRH